LSPVSRTNFLLIENLRYDYQMVDPKLRMENRKPEMVGLH